MEAAKPTNRDLFCTLLGDWLEARGLQAKGVHLNDAEANRLYDREQDLGRQIGTFPVSEPWMIFAKIDLLLHYIGLEGGTGHCDNREVMFLASIKADLLRFEPQIPNEE